VNIKKLIVSTVIVGLAMWIIAGLWHNLILANYYARETEATHDGVGIMLIAYFILALFMSYMYPIGYKGGSPIFEGLRFGALIGLLWVFPHELVMVGAHGEPILYVFKNAIWHMVEQGLGGIVIGLIYNKVA